MGDVSKSIDDRARYRSSIIDRGRTTELRITPGKSPGHSPSSPLLSDESEAGPAIEGVRDVPLPELVDVSGNARFIALTIADHGVGCAVANSSRRRSLLPKSLAGTDSITLCVPQLGLSLLRLSPDAFVSNIRKRGCVR